MSSRRDLPTHTTGAHRAHTARRPKRYERSGAAGRPGTPGRPARTGSATPSGPTAAATAAATATATATATAPGGEARCGFMPDTPELARYEAYLDGLFTYCLSVMCEHDAATTALGEALVLAERQYDRGRAPAQRTLQRPWLYALTRWACLRRLSEQSRGEGKPDGLSASAPHLTDAARVQRRRELAALAWPEAAGTSPEQREALELAVRHGLPSPEVAAVLGLAPEGASALLSHAACEVERTRAALAVVESGGCPAVAALAGDDHLLLGTALRRELVRHVDECAECRRSAERAMAGVGWPGTAPAGTAVLAVLEAPRPAVQAAVLAVRRARCQHTPRFDRNGFPVEVKDRTARRDRLRSRALTTTVVATVIAAPVLALWAAYRGAPLTGESDGARVSSSERDAGSALGGGPYENAAQDGPHARNGHHPDGHSHHPGGKHAKRDGSHGRDDAQARSGDAAGHEGRGGHTGTGAGRLTVDAEPTGSATLIRLTASGGAPVHWSASSDASWLTMSRSSGVLRPGESATIRVTVDRDREPAGAWSGHIRIAPAGAVVTIEGHGAGSPTPPPGDGGDPDPSNPPPSGGDSPSDPPPSSGEPSTPPPSSGEPSGSPS